MQKIEGFFTFGIASLRLAYVGVHKCYPIGIALSFAGSVAWCKKLTLGLYN